MKFRYVLLLGLITIAVNITHMYNMVIGYVAGFSLFIALFANIFVTYIKIGKKTAARVKNKPTIESHSSFHSISLNNDTYINREIELLESGNNRIIYIIAMVVLWVGGLGLIGFHVYEHMYVGESFAREIALVFGYYTSSPVIMVIGYVLLIASLLAMTLNLLKLFREEPMFQKDKGISEVET